VHFAQALDCDLEFALVADGFGGLLGEAEGFGLVEGGDQPVDAGGDEDPVLIGLEHVHALIVGEAGVVDDIDVVAHAHLDAFRGAGVGADALAAAVCFGDDSGGLFFGEVGVLGALGAGDLLTAHD
jgi:hypothetical protein